jgi:hypothetical protein
MHVNVKHIKKNFHDDNKIVGISKDNTRLNPLMHLFEIKTWGTKWKRVIDKTMEWAIW